MNDKKSGSVAEFDQNWQTRKEAQYNHWTRGPAKNQVQLAFKNHYQIFSKLLREDRIASGTCLEVGCGRGSISSYFADDGYDCTLLDYSAAVLKTAEQILASNGHQATFVCGDANDLPAPDNSFDVTVSIGLLEHFEDIRKPIMEQVRVLKPGGRFFGYVVPERPDNVQKYFRWVNSFLSILARLGGTRGKIVQKEAIYRSDLGSRRYLESVQGLPVRDVQAFGLYPMPMISHSPEFPFSLLPPPLEWTLTKLFEASLQARRLMLKRHPWICREEMGQAFLITFRKEY